MPDHALRIAVAEHRADRGAPVAALAAVALVAQHVGHQLGEGLGHVFGAEARLARRERQPVARQRGRDHGEILLQQRDQAQELEHRARPAVRQQQRHGVRAPARRVDEVQVDALHARGELREGVQPRLGRAPVEPVAPVVDQPLHVGEAGAGLPGRRAAARRASACARGAPSGRRGRRRGSRGETGDGTFCTWILLLRMHNGVHEATRPAGPGDHSGIRRHSRPRRRRGEEGRRTTTPSTRTPCCTTPRPSSARAPRAWAR